MRALMMLRDSLEERKKRIEQRRWEAAAPPGSLLAGNSAVIGAMNVIQQRHVVVTGPGGFSSEDEVCADCGTHWKPTAKVESDELRAEIRRLRTEIDSAVDLLGELGRTSP